MRPAVLTAQNLFLLCQCLSISSHPPCICRSCCSQSLTGCYQRSHHTSNCELREQKHEEKTASSTNGKPDCHVQKNKIRPYTQHKNLIKSSIETWNTKLVCRKGLCDTTAFTLEWGQWLMTETSYNYSFCRAKETLNQMERPPERRESLPAVLSLWRTINNHHIQRTQKNQGNKWSNSSVF